MKEHAKREEQAGPESDIYLAHPRERAPRPTEYEPLDLSFSPIPQKKPEKNADEHLDISSDESLLSQAVENLNIHQDQVNFVTQSPNLVRADGYA